MYEEQTKQVYHHAQRLVEAKKIPPVSEVKHRQDGRTDRTPCRIVAHDTDHAFLYHRLETVWHVGAITLRPPLFTLAYYPSSECYNVYWWVDANGSPVAAYFNIVSSDGFWTRAGELHFEDRVLDILMMPDGSTTLLDEDELCQMNRVHQSEARIQAARVFDEAELLLGQAVAQMEVDLASYG